VTSCGVDFARCGQAFARETSEALRWVPPKARALLSPVRTTRSAHYNVLVATGAMRDEQTPEIGTRVAQSTDAGSVPRVACARKAAEAPLYQPAQTANISKGTFCLRGLRATAFFKSDMKFDSKTGWPSFFTAEFPARWKPRWTARCSGAHRIPLRNSAATRACFRRRSRSYAACVTATMGSAQIRACIDGFDS